MSKKATPGQNRRHALRQRAIRDRLAGWRLRARRAATLGLMTAGFAVAPVSAWAQLGQTAMAPAGGVVNRAVAGFQELNQNGPGILYYGINAADRGLGYVGSYMTLGGFIPAVEDDLGGFWAADLRGHLSEYGGFFSNLGAVRKQFIGGTLLGVGVYWDYDGDLNQYPDVVIPSKSGSYVFPGGQVYNQVGISGEWLTDLGNLRSNGYIPVGTTAELAGPFVGNSLLCVNGVNAALSGADLEVGAYIPGLADWAGMVSVGGYALGNVRYDFADGQGAVPWFGGVYTRLDMTFVENWDFSLQANNDSYFDWTGFARLTYRMGGSRRRNVPDQVEQPMMRNEHIVRAHQAPVVATNPNNLDAAGNPLPWQVVHVDNSADSLGDGTAESPFQTLAAAEAAAVAAYDIVYVHVGNSYTTPYITPAAGYSFGNVNQYLIGEGSTLAIPTVSCGNRSLLATIQQNLYPQISNPIGAAINVDQAGTTVSHLQIRNSNVGIADGAGFATPGIATISDVIISGNGGPLQRGVQIANSDGTFNFSNVRLSNLGDGGFVVSAANGDVTIANSSLTDVAGTGVIASGENATVAVNQTTFTRITGTALAATGTNAAIDVSDTRINTTQGVGANAAVASGAGSRIALVDTAMTNIGGSALIASGGSSTITANRSAIITTGGSGIVASGANATVTATGTRISGTGNPGISITGNSARVTLDDTDLANVTGVGVVVSAPNAIFEMDNRSSLTNVTGNGIELLDADAIAYVLGNSLIGTVGGDGILSQGASLLLQESTIRTAGGAGIRAFDVNGPTKVVAVLGGTLSDMNDGGILVSNSNLRVERAAPADPGSRQTSITNAGVFGISATTDTSVNSRVLVNDANISGVVTGITIRADADPSGATVPQIQFTAQDNLISTTNGPGIALSAVYQPNATAPGQPLSRVNAEILNNTITVGGGGEGILLTTVGGPTQYTDAAGNPQQVPPADRPIRVAAGGAVNLGNLNNGTDVAEVPPEVLPGVFSSVNYNPATFPPPPPPPPSP